MELSYVAMSVNGVPIRLLAERWSYTNACLDDVLDTVERPDLILSGRSGTCIAARRTYGGRYLTVSYREVSRGEGFVVSACLVSRIDEGAVIWKSRVLRRTFG
jgi:hypothetical protein